MKHDNGFKDLLNMLCINNYTSERDVKMIEVPLFLAPLGLAKGSTTFTIQKAIFAIANTEIKVSRAKKTLIDPLINK